MRSHTAAVVALAVLGSAGTASATDHLLAGTRLIAKSRSGREKFVWVSKDPAALLPASSPTAVGGVLMVTVGDGGSASVTLGSAQWSATSSGSRVQYRNTDAPAGDSVCKMAIIAAGRFVKVVCKDDLVDTLDPGPEGGVALRLTIGSDNYCAAFGGVVKDEQGRFVARRAPAPGSCDQVPPTTVTSTTSTVPFNCGTTTTITVCGNQATCGFGICPQTQSCTDTGGQCDCTGPAVACGNVGHAALCQYGTCPVGMQCVSLFVSPSCTFGCGCQ